MVWKLLSVMPNIQLLSRFDAGQLCFIPPNDPQLIGIAKHCESTSRLLNHFKTPFNESIRPSALIADESVLPIKEPAVLALRNILALCAHWDAARGIISRDQFLGPYWTDYFDLYPYMPGKKQGVLHTHTPGLHSIDDTDCFDGQTNPLLSAREIVSAVDTDMFFLLTKLWNQHFVKLRPNKFTRALFRSMTVAFEAGRVPNRTEYELFGSRIGDWVSAIEILCRSKIGHVNSKNTTAYYGDINWMIGELSHKRHINMHDKTGKNRLTVVQKLCQQLYCARNAFLHGERIKVSHLRAFGGRSTIMLLHIAPILYRIVIAQMLGTYPSKHKVERMAMEDYLDYRALHKPFENALVAAKHRANTT